ncbi:MAG TPA: rhomboid family intramembrane serine protease [Williamwhitmania sp.]|nr:rhomboid family intramembrane serine protease [Williamwhitmania sp.]
MSIGQEIKESFKQGTTHTKLIYINLGVFIAVNLVNVLMMFGGHADAFSLLPWLQLPSNPAALALRPWTLVTYMFTHEGILHILFNLLVFYWFGIIFLQFFSQKQLLSTYLWGGLAGGGLYILAYNTLPVFADVRYASDLIGASASIMAIVFAAAAYAPNYTVYLMFFGPVKLKYIALGYVVIDIVSMAGTNAGGHIAHIGGAVAGYLIAQKIKQSKASNLGFGWVEGIFSSFGPRKSKMKVVHRRPLTDLEYNQVKAEHQKHIDKILDKINKSGYSSLTKEEREELFNMSNNTKKGEDIS